MKLKLDENLSIGFNPKAVFAMDFFRGAYSYGSNACLILFWIFITSARADGSTPPAQPITGPGGADYAHGQVKIEMYGDGVDQYWIFLPDSPAPKEAPVVVFLHGWGGMNPAPYGAWIKHLARRGNIVIYPRYQENFRTPVKGMTTNAIKAVKAALVRLEKGSIKPAKGQFAIIGHSIGGYLGANMAAAASRSELPIPKAVMLVEPSNGVSQLPDRMRLPLKDLTLIPAATLFLVVTGEDDRIARDLGAGEILKGVPQIPKGNKTFVTMHTAKEIDPPLRADHFAPLSADPMFLPPEPESEDRGGPMRERIRERIKARRAEQWDRDGGDDDLGVHRRGGGPPDALDFYGFWKLADGLLDSAFHGTHREYALGEGEELRFMGRTSGGEALPPMTVRNIP